MGLILVIFTLGFLTACDQVGTEQEKADSAYLNEVAAWFRAEPDFPSLNEGNEYRTRMDHLGSIKPTSRYRNRHDNLLYAHTMLMELDEYIRYIEPREQSIFFEQGRDEVVACVNMFFLREIPLLSIDYSVACLLRNVMFSNLASIEAEWTVSILDIYGEDPYHVLSGVNTAQTWSPTPTYTMAELLADTDRSRTVDQLLDEEFSCRFFLALDQLEPTPTVPPTSTPVPTPPGTPFVAIREPWMTDEQFQYFKDLEALHQDPKRLAAVLADLDRDIEELFAEAKIANAEYLRNCEEEYGGS